jgi:hypothetical protein
VQIEFFVPGFHKADLRSSSGHGCQFGQMPKRKGAVCAWPREGHRVTAKLAAWKFSPPDAHFRLSWPDIAGPVGICFVLPATARCA